MLTHTHDPVFSLLLTIVGALAGFVVGTGVLTLAVRRTISAFDGEHPRNTWLRAFTVAVCVSSSVSPPPVGGSPVSGPPSVVPDPPLALVSASWGPHAARHTKSPQTKP